MKFQRLENVAEIISGQSPPGESYNENGEGLPFFQGKAEFGEISPVAAKWCTEPKKIAEAGDILMSVRAPVGPTNIAKEKCCIGRGLAAIRPDRRKIDRDFLIHFFKKIEKKIAQSGQGSTFQAINRHDLLALEIPAIHLSEQKRIVVILNQAEGIIRLRREQLAKTSALIPALFIDMFGDPATNPKRWDEMTLGDQFKLKSGNFLPQKNMAEDGRFPVYGGNGISGYHNQYLFEDKKIIIGRVGEYCGAVHYAPEKSWITDNALYIAERFKNFEDLFMVEMLRTLHLNKYASRAGQPLVSGGRIYPVKGFLPPFALQTVFSKKLIRLYECIKQAETALEKHEALFQSLLHHAFQGTLTPAALKEKAA